MGLLHEGLGRVLHYMALSRAYTINLEIFIVKIFLDSMGNAKIKHTKIICMLMRYGVVYPEII